MRKDARRAQSWVAEGCQQLQVGRATFTLSGLLSSVCSSVSDGLASLRRRDHSSNALAQIRAFGNVAEGKPEEKDKTKKKRRKKEASAGNTDGDLEPAEAKPAAASAPAPTGAPSGGVTDCCICGHPSARYAYR